MRSFTRFKPDHLDVAYLDFNKSEKFVPEVVALLVNESYSGCGILAVLDTPIAKGAQVRIKVGKMEPIPAEVAWINDLGESTYKLGLNFIE